MNSWRLARRAAGVVALSLAIIAVETVVNPTASLGSDVTIELRVVTYRGSTASISGGWEHGVYTYRINEGDSRAQTRGLQFNIHTRNLPTGEPYSFDIVLEGTAELGTDYSINSRDVKPSRCLTPQSTRCNYKVTGESGDELWGFRILIHDDDVFDPDETVVVKLENISGGRFLHDRSDTLRIVDDDDPIATLVFRAPVYDGSTTAITRERDHVYRVREGDERAKDNGVKVFVCTEFTSAGTVSYDIDLRGSAAIGFDYSLHPRDVQSSEFPTGDSTRASYSFDGDSGSSECRTVTIKIRDDSLDESQFEDITFTIRNQIGAMPSPTNRITIQIEDNDSDRAVTFHTQENNPLPSVLSEDLFQRERGSGYYSFDPSKNFEIAGRNPPGQGSTSLEVKFSGTAELGVDYYVWARSTDSKTQGHSVRQPRQGSPILTWTFWRERLDERRMTFTIKVVDDSIEEDTETIVIDINPGNLQLDGRRGSKRITLRLFDNDRPAPAAEAGVTIASAPSELEETLSSWQMRSPDNFRAEHEVNLEIPSHSVILSLSFSLEGTATRCADFVVNHDIFPGDSSGCNSEATTARFHIAQRVTSYRFRLRQVDDSVYEPGGEQIVVHLGRNSQNSEVKRNIAIVDNDELPLISITSPSVTEGDAGDSMVLSYQVSKAGTTEADVTVDYEIADTGTATSSGSGADFTHTVSSPLTFSATESTKNIDVTVSGDSLAEVDETVVVRLSKPVNAGFGGSDSTIDGTGTIENDDFLELSISDQEVVEGGDGNTTAMTFTVRLGAETPADVTVEYEVTGGTATGDATAGEDFTATSGTLTFSSDDPLTKTIDVMVIGDVDNESNETLTVTLSNPQCGGCPAGITASLKSGEETATGTILDDEGVLMSISDPEVSEGDAGNSTMLIFDVTLSKVGVQEITVAYSVLSTSTAESGTDFEAVADGTLTFDHAESETSMPIPVTVTGDATYEENETVLVELSGLTGGAQFSVSASTITGTGTITNDDDAPLLTISSNIEEDEGDAGGTTVLSFEVTKSGATALPAMVNYAFADSGTATATGEEADFTHAIDSPLTFSATETTKTIEVAVVGDEIAEDNETVVVELSSPDNARFTSPATTIEGTGTIRNDDDYPLLSFGMLPAVDEGVAGDTTMLRFEVIKEGETALPATVTYAISGTAAAAGDDADFTHVDTSLSIPVDQESAHIDIAVSGDDLFEDDETVIVTLTSLDNARFAAGATELAGEGSITNDDFLHVSFEGEDIPEGGDEDTAALTFTATLAARSSQAITVDYEVITTGSNSGTAEHGAGADYLAASPSGTLTFAADTAAPQMQTFEVTVYGDADRELDETVVARLHRLSVPAEFSEDTAATEILGTGTIINDDNPTFAVSSPRIDEGRDGETADMIFEVTLSPAWNEVVTVDYDVAGGTVAGAATADEDFIETSGTLTFNPGAGGAPGETVMPVNVEILGDDYDESDEETVTLVLSNASPNALIRTAEWTGVIVDDDDTPVFSIDSPRVDEGDTGMVDMVFTVTKTGDTRLDTSVEYAVTDGTAAGGEGSADDYVPLPSGLLDFAPSEVSKQVTLQVRGDSLAEADETVAVMLLSPDLASIDPNGATGTGTIANDDDLAISINSPSAEEVDSGATSIMTFTVSLDAETPADVTVDYEVTGGSAAGEAAAGEDFTQTSGTLTFTPGGGLTQEFEVTIIGDALSEGRETLAATLSNPACAMCPAGIAPRIEAGTGTGTIVDNEALSISINDPSVFEGNAGESPTLDFEVTLDFVWNQDVSVRYGVSTSSTAESGVDFEELADGTLTFDSSLSEVSKTIPVRVIGDTLAEDSKTVVIELSGATGNAVFLGGASSTTATGTIFNDDFSYTVETSTPTVTEPDTGTVDLEFTVTLTPAATSEFPVRYTFGGTATEDFDFTDATRSSAPGVLTFGQGESSRTIQTLVHSDFVAEDEETVTVTLVDESGDPIDSTTATATIQPPATSVGGITIEVLSPQVAVDSSDSSAQVEFDLSLSATQSSEVTVAWVLSEVTFEELDEQASPLSRTADRINVLTTELARGTATLPVGASDATARSTLNAGIDISSVYGQLVIEMERPTGVDGIEIQQAAGISAPVQAAVDANGRVAAAIFDAPNTGQVPSDDGISISIAGPSSPVTEPDTGTVDLDFSVALSGAASSDVSVTYTFSGTAAEGADFMDATTGATDNVLTIAQGNRTATISARVNSDFVADDDETVIVTLSNANGASIASGGETATGTIESAASTATAVTLSISSPQVAMGGSNSSPQVEFDLSLSATQSSEVTVAWVLSEVTFEEMDGQASPLSRAADRRNVVTTELASGTATVPDGDTAATAMAALDANTDISSIDGQLVIEVARPTGVEGIEIHQAAGISAPVQAAVHTNGRVAAAVFHAPGTGPAPSDDGISISIEGPSPVTEPDADSSPVDLVFSVMLSEAASSDVSVTYTFSGTAAEGADFMDATVGATDNVLTIAQGERAATITAQVNSDFVADDDETVIVTLSDANGASIASGEGTATGTIVSAASTATAATLSVSSARIARSKDDGSPVVEFTLRLSEMQSSPVMVMWVLNEARDDAAHREVASGSATLPTDETAETVSEPLTSGITIQSIRGRLVLEMAAPMPPEIQIEQAANVDSSLQAAAHSNNRVVVAVFSAGSRSRDWAITSALSGFGRSAAVSLVNTIWSRAEAHRHGGVDSHVSLGGRSVDVSAYSPGADARSAARETARVLGLETAEAYPSSADWADGEPHISGGLDDFRGWASLPDSDRIAGESSFALALGAGPAGGSSVVYWGAGSNGSFGSELEHDDGEFPILTTDGSSTAISLGFDYRMSESMLMGLAVSSVSGSVEYSFAQPSDERGELSPSLNTFTPWLRWQSLTGLEVWGAFGFGSGSAEATHGSEKVDMDISSQTIAAGFWNRVASFGSVGVAAKADAFIASLSTDGAGDAVDDAGAESQRIRLAAEMTPGYADFASRSTTYSFELGARQDGGEAESGVGVDAAGNFSYTSPGGGFQVSGRGSLVVFHGQDGFSETGLGLGLSYDPGGDSRGIQLSLEPVWNAPRTSVANSMWSADSSSSMSLSSSEGALLKARLSYGVGMARERALATMYGESDTSESESRLRLGTELSGEDGPLELLRFNLYGEREESDSSASAHAVMLEARIGL